MKDPAFLFYPGDYLRDTQCLSEKSQVAYDRILCEHMRNICITQQQLNFFTKRLSEEEKSELHFLLTKINGGFQISWVAESIIKRREYSKSRSSNRKKGLKSYDEHMKSYDEHMENENENENDIENINEEKFNFKKSLISLGINETLVSEWLLVRKQKKATNTKTAFNAIKREIEKAGLTPNECLNIAVEKSWCGFEAEWILNKNFSNNGQNIKRSPDLDSKARKTEIMRLAAEACQ